MCGDTPCDGPGEECVDGTCVDCDGDDDGYYADMAACEGLGPAPRDCDDSDDTIHPNALPTCGDMVDQGCLGDGTAFFGIADEMGSYPSFEVRVEPGGTERPRQLRLFMLDRTRGLIVYQHGESRRTPYFGEIDLEGDPTTVVPVGYVEMAAGHTFASEPLRADAIRTGDGEIRLGVVGGDSGTWELTLFGPTGDPGSTSWTILETRTVTASDAGLLGFTTTGTAALLELTGTMGMAIAGTLSGEGTLAVLSFDGSNDGVKDSPMDPGPGWLVSSGTGVVAPDEGGHLRFWFGSTDAVQVNGDAVPTPIAAAPYATMLRSIGTREDGRQLFTILPQDEGLQAFATECGPAATLQRCGFTELPAPPLYEVRMASPVVGATRMSGTSVTMVFPGPTEESPFRLSSFENEGGTPTELDYVDAEAVGTGVVREIAVDAMITPASAGAEYGEVTVGYAYLREDASAGRRIYVSSYRVCIGYGTK